MHKRKKAYTVEEAYQQWLEEQQPAKRPHAEIHHEDRPTNKLPYKPHRPQGLAGPTTPFVDRVRAHQTTLHNIRDEEEIQDHMSKMPDHEELEGLGTFIRATRLKMEQESEQRLKALRQVAPERPELYQFEPHETVFKDIFKK